MRFAEGTKASSYAFWLTLFGILAACVAVILFFARHKQQDNAVPSVPPDAVPTYRLRDAYDTNEVSADRFYGGKRIKVVGNVESVSKGVFGTPYINLMDGITCEFSESDLDHLAKLTKGERIVIEGTCRGKILVQCTVLSEKK